MTAPMQKQPARHSQFSAGSHYWITNAMIVTQDQKRAIYRGNLHIREGRIAEIKKSLPQRGLRSSENTKVIDAKGLVVLPGFVQAHVHLCQTLFRNQADDLELLDWLRKRIWVFEAAHTPATLRTSARWGIHELLATGTTCLLDMGTVRHTEEIFQAVQETGIRASVGKCLMDHPRTTPPGLREKTDVALEEAVALYDRWHGAAGDRIRASFAPRFVVSCTEELLTQVARLSQTRNALIHTHASENLKEVQLVKKLVGCENVEYLHQLEMTSSRLVLAHCIWLKPHEKEILRRTGTHVAHCPSSNLKLASGIAHIPELLAQGVNVALGADGAPCNNNLNLFQEMRLAALIHKPGNGPRSIRAQDALDMATRNGAKALNWFNDIGSIEVGKKADLIAVDLQCLNNQIPFGLDDPASNAESIVSALVYSSGPENLRWTMVDGRVLYQSGSRAWLNKIETLLHEVRAAQRTIRQRTRTTTRSKLTHRKIATTGKRAKPG